MLLHALSWAKQDQQPPQALCFLLHGYGANNDDLMPIAYDLSAYYPNTLFVSLAAPFTCPGVPRGRQWFNLQPFWLKNEQDRLAINSLSGVFADCLPAITETISHYMAKHAVSWAKTSVIGFSQGAALAMHLALNVLPFACAVAIAGFAVPLATSLPAASSSMSSSMSESSFSPLSSPPSPSLPAANEQQTTPLATPLPTPICWLHGLQDTVVAIDFMYAGVNYLRNAQANITSIVLDDLGHSIDHNVLAHTRAFLTMHTAVV